MERIWRGVAGAEKLYNALRDFATTYQTRSKYYYEICIYDGTCADVLPVQRDVWVISHV